MAKNDKDLNEDILSGGSISGSGKKDSASKKAAAQSKRAKKLAEKRSALEKELQQLKSKRDVETSDAKKQELNKQIDAVRNKMDRLNGKKSGVSSNTARVIKGVVAAVVVVALLVTYVCTGTVRKGFVHSVLQWTTGITAATITDKDGDKIRIPVSTYNYYFANTYNNLMSTQQTYEQYGLDLAENNLDVDFDIPLSKQTTTNEDDEVVTWLEYLNEQVLEGIKTTYAYYNEAVAANGGEEPEITEEQQTQIDAYIAQNYQSEMSENVSETEYTDADFEEYRDANISDFEAVSVRIFEAGTEDDAASFKDALRADGSNFSDLAVQYSDDTAFNSEYYAQDEATTKRYATRQVLQNGGYAIATAEEHTHEEGEEHSEDEELSYPGLDWLFSADRAAGDIYQYSTTVVYVLEPVSVPEAESANVRHILVAPETDDDSTDATSASAEQWSAAYEKAEDIVSQYESGERTEASFEALVADNTDDTGSASTGGLYESVVPGQMVDAFEAWSLDPARRAGDIDIVQTEYGYHIMYFVGGSGTPIWRVNAESAVASRDAESAADEIDSNYSISLNWFGRFYIEKDTDIDA